MRNARPLHVQFVIYHDILAVVQDIQLSVEFTEHVCGKALAVLRLLIDHQFELRKHGLAVKRRAELLQEVIYKVCPALLVRGYPEQVLHEQALVAGGSYLRHKDDVVRINHRLVLIGKVGVDSVTHLVRQREFAVKGVLVVQQHIGVYSRAGGICAAALPLVLVNVYPAVLNTLAEYRTVVLAHRRQGVVDLLLCLLERDLHLNVADDGSIQVVGMQLVNAQQLLAELHILVHVVHVLVDCLNKLLVNLHRNLVAVERCLERAVVLPRPGTERQALHLGSQNRRRGIPEVLIYSVQALKRRFAQLPVVGVHERNVASVSYLVLVPVLVGGVREFQVGVVEHREDIVRGACHFAGQRHDTLLRLGENMRAFAAHSVNAQAVKLHFRLLPEETLHGVVIYREYLGGHERCGAGNANKQHFQTADHVLVLRVPGILVVPALGVVNKTLQQDGHIVVRPEVFQQLCGIRAQQTLI